MKQCSHEYRWSTLIDKDVYQSIQMLRERYISDPEFKSIPGFIQYFSTQPLTPALWTSDVELFHKMPDEYSLVVDAIGSIAHKLVEKKVFYFAFLSNDRSVKTEAVAHIEVLTDLSTTNTLRFILNLEDEMKRFNYTNHSVLLLCTTKRGSKKFGGNQSTL